MDLDKAQRKLEQEQKAYGLKKQQEVNKVERKYINYVRSLSGWVNYRSFLMRLK